MATSFDAIILGSGPNELACAARIAKSGAKVLVLERSSVVGGIAGAFEFAPGFSAAVAPAEAGFVSPRVANELGLAAHGWPAKSKVVDLVALAREGQPLVFASDGARTRESIAQLSKRDSETWERFSTQMHRLAGFLETLYEDEAIELVNPGAGELMALAGHGLRLRRLGKGDMIEMLRALPMALWDLLGDSFENERVTGALAATGLANLFQGPRSAGTGFTFLHHHVGRARGAFGSRAVASSKAAMLPNVLAALCKSLGVEIRTGADASVIVRAGAAAGVLASGEELAARVVVSGADPKRAFAKDLAPWHLPPEFVEKVGHVKLRGVRAVMMLAVNALPPLRGVGPALAEGTMLVAESMTKLERAFDAAKHGGISDEPMLEITVPSLHASDLAPSAKHVVHVAAQFAPYRLRSSAAGWDDAARALLEKRIMDTLEAYAPGMRDTVEAKKLFAPPDLESEFGLTEGHLLGGELTLDQILFMRPVAGFAHHATPVPGYFVCGDATHPAAGIACVSGLHAARRALERLRA